ncbi:MULTISPECIES: sugar ABC transporter ATP-binding protein [unclassified Luteibacter]|uniref:sugar ABC transporter ATP-binding protein n=1 Tax=unclassified Luteibacter TaxID=2620188 RepID=UPI0008C8F3E8|nr:MULTISPECIES: sugar ABC transporter ATP-binding protein [unclassified Luteibacter]MDR6937512.1 ribose transport system ATP-binding protein [Luteibacter sp. 3190]SEO35246.1 ribose transport system ATP-binding protein [Luteibacter sp. UNC138MFCol5.1]SEW23962.1 ribose ABC transporter ATP-binding protein [Luteibacter sp. 329MFSha]
MSTPLVTMRDIHKAFGPVKVLEGVDFELLPGEVHALMGENGAGKSTLMKILTGIYAPDSGTVEVDGKAVSITTPADAEKYGIAIIHQELNLIPALSIADNLFLGREIQRFGLLDHRAMTKRALEWLARVGMERLDPTTKIERLSVGQQQMVEIARALGQNARVLIMDEPTAALTEHETNVLFKLIRDLRDQGTGIVYVSHRMEEIFALCDRISILRDGKFVGTRPVPGLAFDEVVKMMVGRTLDARFPTRTPNIGAVRLKVDHVTGGIVQDVSFELHAGEVLGVAGLLGAGRTEMARLLFGLDKLEHGTVTLDGKVITPKSPSEAIHSGFGFVTEDRKAQGLVLDMSLRENVSLPRVPAHAGLIDRPGEKKQTRGLIDALKIRTRDMELDVRALSGGNQQKVVLAKWLALKPRVLILDEPTRGVDVGGKAEIYHIINQLAEQGVAILMISSELPEVLAMSDRILVMHEGRATGLLEAHGATQEAVMTAATGGK